MNYQFFATAGVISFFILIIDIVLFILVMSDNLSWTTDEICWKICWISFCSMLAFWVVIGALSVLSLVWGWGLVIS